MKLTELDKHIGLVGLHAGKLFLRTPPSVDYEELFAAGLVGLADAITKFNGKKRASFKTYASIRIRGAMFDEMKKMDWVPRRFREKSKRTGVATREMLLIDGTIETPAKEPRHLELSVDLERAVNRLSRKERTILRMYYYDGLAIEKIGELFGVSQGAISHIHMRAIRRLKSMLRFAG